jgi:hypothetical protein
MTVTEAIQRTNQLLRNDADTHSTMCGILDPRTREALAKLVTIATEKIFGPNRGTK